MIKVVMIEDDLELAYVLSEYLKKFSIEVTNYEDAYTGLSALNVEKYDLLILDLTLRGIDGIEVCKEIRKHHDIPIIISSARSDIADKIITLQLGADDYLPKPYDPRELEVRIRSVLRRYNYKKEEKIKEKIFKVDIDKQEITKNNIFIKFTPAEFEVLSYLIQKSGYLISRDSIFENSMTLNNDENIGSLAVIINRIRQKIEENPKEPKYLLTIRGLGYKFVQ